MFTVTYLQLWWVDGCGVSEKPKTKLDFGVENSLILLVISRTPHTGNEIWQLQFNKHMRLLHS